MAVMNEKERKESALGYLKNEEEINRLSENIRREQSQLEGLRSRQTSLVEEFKKTLNANAPERYIKASVGADVMPKVLHITKDGVKVILPE